jgi:hypothetical protein
MELLKNRRAAMVEARRRKRLALFGCGPLRICQSRGRAVSPKVVFTLCAKFARFLCFDRCVQQIGETLVSGLNYPHVRARSDHLRRAIEGRRSDHAAIVRRADTVTRPEMTRYRFRFNPVEKAVAANRTARTIFSKIHYLTQEVRSVTEPG